MASQDFENEILKLDIKKAALEDDIPTKMLIIPNDIVSNHLTKFYNTAKNDQHYSTSLKLAKVIPVHKKEEKTLMKDYRPVSLLPIVSKLFERIMYNRIIAYIDKFLSTYLFGFRKGHSTEQCLIVMLEAWKKALDGKHNAGAILTDLSKEFDCINHDLLIAKLRAYRFDHESQKFIYSYLKERKHRTKVGCSFSTWKIIKYGVPQGSILGPLLFNIFLNDIFYFINNTQITNYADDNSTYSMAKDVHNLLAILKDDTSLLLDWFKSNEMKSNEDKCHLLVINHQEDVHVKLGNEKIEGSSSVDLLGIKIDNNLNFNEHVSKLCKKGNQKLHALARISKYLCKDKLKIILKTFIISQFNYCPLTWMFHNRTLNNKTWMFHNRTLNNKTWMFHNRTLNNKTWMFHNRTLNNKTWMFHNRTLNNKTWMFHNRTLNNKTWMFHNRTLNNKTWMFHNRTFNNKINRLHERASRLAYDDDNSSFQELLNLDNSMTIHHRNLHKLATEMYKTKNNLSPIPVQEIFKEHVNLHDLRNNRSWDIPNDLRNNRSWDIPNDLRNNRSWDIPNDLRNNRSWDIPNDLRNNRSWDIPNDLRNNRSWDIPNARTVHYGTETIRFRGPKTWEILPTSIKESKTLSLK